MPLFRYSASTMEPLTRTTLAAEKIRERDDLQSLLMKQMDVISDDLLVIAEEYSLFKDSRRRIDILAIDRTGTLVVIELKRTEDGGHMELQSLRYAAMVSTVTLDHVVQTLADAKSISIAEAKESILDWVEEPIEELPNHVRIVLISADFSTEITSTVLWLNENYSMDISCFRIVAYKLGSEILLDLQQIIPLPEAKDFQIQQRQKGAAATAVRTSGRDFTRYTLSVGDAVYEDMSKQGAVKLAIQKLFHAGVEVAHIQSATKASQWRAVRPAPGEAVRDAFLREYPGTGPAHRWFDLGVVADDVTWVIPRFGGTETEAMLGALSALSPGVGLRWSRVERDELTPAG